MTAYSASDNILMILPALLATRQESDIVWYEVQVTSTSRMVNIIAFNEDGEKVGTIETKLVSDNDIQTVILQGGNRLTCGVTFEARDSDNFEVEGHINNYKFSIGTPGMNQESAQAIEALSLNLAEWRILVQWMRLGDSLSALSKALRARETTDTWGSTACTLLAAATTAHGISCGILHDPISCEGYTHEIQQHKQHCVA